MAVLCFAKNKFPNFLYLSNSATPSASGIHKIWIKRNCHTKNQLKIATLTIKTKIAN